MIMMMIIMIIREQPIRSNYEVFKIDDKSAKFRVPLRA